SELGFDLFQWLRELRLQKIVANRNCGFHFHPTVEFLRAAVPKVNSTLHRASHDAVVDQFKNILWLLQRRHYFLHYILWLGHGLVCACHRVSRARVNFNQCSELLLELQGPTAFYHHPAALSGSMYELAFPSSVSNEFGFDLFQWLRKLRP